MLSFALLILLLATSAFAFQRSAINSRKISSIKKKLALSMMSGGSSLDMFGMIPLCLEATSKTTTINDPTAGMSAAQITDYMSNVGGGMCGYPEIVRTTIGLGLNLSLIVFGFFTVSYVVLGGYNFALEKGVDDSLKAAEANVKRGSTPMMMGDEASDNDFGAARAGGSNNREKRRLNQRLKKGEKE